MRTRTRVAMLSTIVASFLVLCCLDVSAQVGLGPSGGDGGVAFEDRSLPGPGLTLPAFLHVSRIRICSGSFVDSIQFTWQTGTTVVAGERHGGGGGVCRTHTLASDERILRISGRYGRFVDSIVITTNRKRAVPIIAGGPGGRAAFFYEVPGDASISALNGRSGDFLDAIGIITTR